MTDAELILQLREEIRKRDEIIEMLTKRVEELERKLSLNSKNSSKPPSTDGPSAKKLRNKRKSARKIGGQKGHKGVSRKMIPENGIHETIQIPLKNPSCECGCKRFTTKKFSKRHQVWEIPEIKPHITEYQLESARCKACRKRIHANLPAGISKKTLGPNAQSWIGLLTGVYRLSRSNAQRFLEEVCGIKRSTGNISDLEKDISNSVKPFQTQAFKALRESSLMHMDETGHKRQGKRLQTWVMANESWSYFLSGVRRNRKVLKALLGKTFSGLVVSDRYCSYSYLPASRHQYCWAHIHRQIKGLSEYLGDIGIRAREIIQWMGWVFKLYQRREDVSLSYYQRVMDFYRTELKGLFLEGFLAHFEFRKFSRLFALEDEKLWHFAENSDIPMTNNQAERDIRPSVIWRKTSFGTQSIRGDRYRDRMLSLSSSLRKQGNPLFETLQTLISARMTSADPAILYPTT